ncbi:hypothetical protein KIPB_001630 [Kipferlia bialata]|uniref:Haloacid dehalogenase n=1 Tax=Kipferlia bialata TaxID=797122 RepID=A0A9K3CQA3_9EUKA|nr:hypothetical protein KIPB_001630 [Kipferlia bialata]|eukprot:g1630.t1
MTRPIEAVLFDLYGTLIDRSTLSVDPYLTLAGMDRADMDRAECIDMALTQRTDTLAEYATKIGLGDVETAQLEERLCNNLSSLSLYPDALSTISTLREKGDSYKSDVQGAISCGMPYMWQRRDGRDADADRERVIHSLEEVITSL